MFTTKANRNISLSRLFRLATSANLLMQAAWTEESSFMGGAILDTENIQSGNIEELKLSDEDYQANVVTNANGNTGSGHSHTEYNQEYKLTLANK